MHLPGAKTPKMVHPDICPYVTHYLKSGKKHAHTGCTGIKTCAPSVKMCTPGAGCTLDSEHCKGIYHAGNFL